MIRFILKTIHHDEIRHTERAETVRIGCPIYLKNGVRIAWSSHGRVFGPLNRKRQPYVRVPGPIAKVYRDFLELTWYEKEYYRIDALYFYDEERLE